MQSTSDNCCNVLELANQLRREKLYISTELLALQGLNEKIEKTSLDLVQASWICTQQILNLNNLISSRSESESVAACQRASLLEFTKFVDAHKVLKYKEVVWVGELLAWVRGSPRLLARWLARAEPPTGLPHALVAGLYGSGRSRADLARLLRLLHSLLAAAPDPRKAVRSSTCAFARVYAAWRDTHAPARLFLITALQAPIQKALQEDDFFLDIDPDKALERFTSADRLKKFGQPNSADYKAKVARYRKWTVRSLAALTQCFVAALRESWGAFPAGVARLARGLAARLPSPHERHAAVADLVFAHYVCAAIVSPEAHGLVNVPVSYVARFNLIQVAQIIQMLCLAKYQEVEPKVRDLYSKLDKECVWGLLDALLGDAFAECDALDADLAPDTRSVLALFTRDELNMLVWFLQKMSSRLNNNAAEERLECDEASSSSSDSSSGKGNDGESTTPDQSMEPNYRSRLHDFLKKMPDFNVALPPPPNTTPTPDCNGAHPPQDSSPSKKGLLGKVSKSRVTRAAVADEGGQEGSTAAPEVLMVRLPGGEQHEYVGLLSEAKVLESYYLNLQPEPGDDGAQLLQAVDAANTDTDGVVKRTRFSVCGDEVSLGNTSDNLEAVSEAASNHSVTSSLELETEDQNDNLSDMVSANVSGRGSPNISGRDTPSSQVTEGEAGPLPPPPARAPSNVAGPQARQQAMMLKQAHNEIEDRFCKFEIKKLLEGDETISIMSDTWSTDVLASDSETVADCERAQLPPPPPGGTNGMVPPAPDVSETASESAWSIDVLASDSDRNTEVDTDDCVSIAARSDTSWPRRPSQPDTTRNALPQSNGGVARRSASSHGSLEAGSPRPVPATSPANRSSPVCGESREAELPAELDGRKSILLNGYPVSIGPRRVPESPLPLGSPARPAALLQQNHLFHFPAPHSETDSTSDWVHGVHREYGSEQAVRDDGSLPSSDGSDHSPHHHAPATTKSQQTGTTASDSDRSSSQEAPRAATPPPAPSAATGAIPKSISFDASAEKQQRRRCSEEELEDVRSSARRAGANFFNKIKLFRHKSRLQAEKKESVEFTNGGDIKVCVESNGADVTAANAEDANTRTQEVTESTEDILAKYRRKASGGSEGRARTSSRRASDQPTDADAERSNIESWLDLNNPEVFNIVKRKLRAVLANPDLHCTEFIPGTSIELGCYARAGGAGANAATLAVASEAAQIAHAAGNSGCARLLAALRSDLAARRPYTAYLASSRRALLTTLAALQRELSRAREDAALGSTAAAAARALQQLERGPALRRLLRTHHAPTIHGSELPALADERAARLAAAIKAITAELKTDPSWEGASSNVLETVERTVERAAFARVYLHAMFPNGDGDIARDQVLSEHIRRLGTLSPVTVGVCPRHAAGAPWLPAQRHLTALSACHAPYDKVQCVLLCATAIQALLSLADEVPAADDITPVLVYVIIKVNPPSLLSTIQLVNSLGAPQGEALYWWTQFSAAVQHIKTMDYLPRRAP